MASTRLRSSLLALAVCLFLLLGGQPHPVTAGGTAVAQIIAPNNGAVVDGTTTITVDMYARNNLLGLLHIDGIPKQTWTKTGGGWLRGQTYAWNTGSETVDGHQITLLVMDWRGDTILAYSTDIHTVAVARYALVMVYAVCDSGCWDPKNPDPGEPSLDYDFKDTYKVVWDRIRNGMLSWTNGLVATTYWDHANVGPATEIWKFGNPFSGSSVLSIRTAGETSSGNPSTLAGFIAESISFVQDLDPGTQSTIRKILVCFDHGHGWCGFGRDRNPQPEDWLTPNELRQALDGYSIDVVLFHACLMGDFEVAYELRDVVDYMIAAPTPLTRSFSLPGGEDPAALVSDLESYLFNAALLTSWLNGANTESLVVNNFRRIIDERLVPAGCILGTVCVATYKGTQIDALAAKIDWLGDTLNDAGPRFQWTLDHLDLFLRADLYANGKGGLAAIYDLVERANSERGVPFNEIDTLIAELLVDEQLEGEFYLPIFLPNASFFVTHEEHFGASYVESYIYHGADYSTFIAAGWQGLIHAIYDELNPQ